MKVNALFIGGEEYPLETYVKKVPRTHYYQHEGKLGFVLKKKPKMVFVEKSLYNINEWIKKTPHSLDAKI